MPAPTPVHREQRMAPRRAIGAERLDEHQLGALELRMLLRGHDIADDARNLHQRSTYQLSTIPTMPASTGASTG